MDAHLVADPLDDRQTAAARLVGRRHGPPEARRLTPVDHLAAHLAPLGPDPHHPAAVGVLQRVGGQLADRDREQVGADRGQAQPLRLDADELANDG